MGGYFRSIYGALLEEPRYQQLSSEARLLLLTLRLASQNNLAGVFVCYREPLELQTGLSPRKVKGSLAELEAGGWIECDNHLLWVVEQIELDPGHPLRDRMKRRSIERILDSLPVSPLLRRFADRYGFDSRDVWPGAGQLSLLEDTSGEAQPTIHNPQPTTHNRAPSRGPTRGPTRGPLNSAQLLAFEQFWAAYPLKTAKDEAKRAWKTVDPPLGVVLGALAWQKQSSAWARDGGRYIPYPASYLRSGQWRDEKPTAEMGAGEPRGYQGIRDLAATLAGGGGPDDESS